MPVYDDVARRQAQRRGREKGCWVYVPAAELLKAGHDTDGPPPLYRTWGRSRGSVLVRLYPGRIREALLSPDEELDLG